MTRDSREAWGNYLFLVDRVDVDDGWCSVVEFRNTGEVVRAIRDLHNTTLNSRVIYIKEVSEAAYLLLVG